MTSGRLVLGTCRHTVRLGMAKPTFSFAPKTQCKQVCESPESVKLTCGVFASPRPYTPHTFRSTAAASSGASFSAHTQYWSGRTSTSRAS